MIIGVNFDGIVATNDRPFICWRTVEYLLKQNNII